MSAAATAAGYLYASGRLRGRAQREQEQHGEHLGEEKRGEEKRGEEKREQRPAARPRIERPRKEVRVAALPEAPAHSAPEKPRRTPTIQYRTKRWRPTEESQ